MAVYRVTISGTLFSQKVQNVLAFRKPEVGVSDADKSLLAGSIINAWLAQVRFLVRVVMNWNEVKVQAYNDPNDLPAIVPTNVSGFISGNNDVFPPLCAVYRIKTAIGGRRGRGRFYISGCESVGLIDGRWDQNMINNFNSVANSLKGQYINPPPASGFELGVMRRGGVDADFIPATNLVIRDYPGTQRRRNFFVGI